jgi:hypothetical protein
MPEETAMKLKVPSCVSAWNKDPVFGVDIERDGLVGVTAETMLPSTFSEVVCREPSEKASVQLGRAATEQDFGD